MVVCVGRKITLNAASQSHERIDMRDSIFRIASAVFIAGLLLSASPNSVLAYGGPGSVISGIGTLLAAVAAVFAALFGFIWFPLKRLYQKLTEDREEEAEGA